MPALALVKITGKSACSSFAPSSTNRSNVSLTTSCGRASLRSILLITTIARRSSSSAFRSTKRVCGITPSAASTSSSTPCTICSTRSTSPPKSECPGVSTMLNLMGPWRTAVFLASIVIPRSRSSGLESITRVATSWPSRNTPLCLSIASTSVVLPWSTCAMMATLRMSERVFTAICFATLIRLSWKTQRGCTRDRHTGSK